MFSVGFLAVIFYRQRRRGNCGQGRVRGRLGASGGLLCFAMSSVFEALIVTLFHKGPELRDAILAKIQQTASQTTDPQVLGLFDRMKTPEGLEVLMVAG